MIDRRSLLAQAMLVAGAADTATVLPSAEGNTLGAGGGVLGPGEHRVATDLTVSGDLILLPGARIVVSTGATLTLLGDFDAPASAVFTGAGRVDLNRSRARAAYPEWWGSRTGDSAFDNRPALQACVAAHPVAQLQCADYFIADTWRIDRPHRAVRGVDNHWSGPGTATRIVIARARAAFADVIQIGSEQAGGDDYLFKVRLSNLHLTRDGSVQASSGRADGGPAGLRLQRCREVLLEDITAEGGATGFYVGGVVHSFLRRCVAARTQGPRGGGRDECFGFVLDGQVATGYAGGNASVYLEDCTFVGPGSRAATVSTAALLSGAFADTYLSQFECSSCTFGIRLQGLGAGSQAPRAKTGNADVHIIMPILDQCGTSGIEIANLSDYGMVDIVTPYVTPAPGGLAAVHVHDGGGLVTISGGQLIGWGDAEAGGNAIGVHVVNVSGLTVLGTKILGCRRPLGLTGCRNFNIDVAINNPAQRASQAAVQLAACDRGSIRVLATGGASVFPQGVRLDGQANTHIAVDVTGIDPAAISGGETNKLLSDRTPIRAAGPFGTNQATGIFT